MTSSRLILAQTADTLTVGVRLTGDDVHNIAWRQTPSRAKISIQFHFLKAVRVRQIHTWGECRDFVTGCFECVSVVHTRLMAGVWAPHFLSSCWTLHLSLTATHMPALLLAFGLCRPVLFLSQAFFRLIATHTLKLISLILLRWCVSFSHLPHSWALHTWPLTYTTELILVFFTFHPLP